MDYFKFDLQLFATDTPVALTGMTAEKTVYAKISGVTDWYTEAEVNAAQTAATLTGIYAQWNDGTKTLLAAAGDTEGNTVTISGADAAAMKGVKITLANAITSNGSAISSTTSAKSFDVGFTDNSLKHMTLNIKGDKGTTNVLFDATTACKVTGTAGATITVPHPKNAEKTLAMTATAGTVTLLSTGTGDVVASDFGASTIKMVDSLDNETGTMTVTAGSVSTEGSETLDFAVTGSVLGNWDELSKANATFTIDDETGKKYFSDMDKTAEPPVMKQVDAQDITDWTASDEGPTKVGDVKLTLANQATTEGDTETPGKPYYALTYDASTGKYAVTNCNATELAANENAIGYFMLTIEANYLKPIATVEFFSGKATGESATKSAFLGKVVVDAGNLETLDFSGKKCGLNKLVCEDICYNSGDTGVINLPNTATVDTIEEGFSYLPTDALGSAGTITIPTGLTVGKTAYYVISTSGGDKAAKGVTTYNLAANMPQDTVPESGAYIAVAATTVESKTQYAVTFHDANNVVKKDIWAGITVDAQNITDRTSTILITGDATTEGAADKYAVTNVLNGIEVSTPSAKNKFVAGNPVTRTATDAIIGSVTNSISLAGALEGGSKKPYYAVTFAADPATGGEKVTYNGKRVATLTAQADEPDSGAYFHVTQDANGVVTIVYVNNDTKQSLSGITTNGTTKVYVDVDASGVTTKAMTGLVITDTTSAATAVDYNITSIPGGVAVTGADANKDVIAYDTSKKYYNITGTVKLTDAVMPDKPETDSATKSVFYAVTETTGGIDGQTNVAIGTKSEASTGMDNYFEVKATITSLGAKSYEVIYHKNGDPTKAIDLSATAGKVNVDFAGIEGEYTGFSLRANESGNEANTLNPAVYNVTNLDGKKVSAATEALIKTVEYRESTGPKETVLTGHTTYVNYYEISEAKPGLTLGAVTQYYKVGVSDARGIYTYTFELNDTPTSAPASGSYFAATVAEGVLTLTFVEKEGGVTREDLTTLAAQTGAPKILVDAASIGSSITSIVLPDETAGAINFSVTEVPKTATVTGDGTGDEVLYHQTYVLDASKAKITLGATEGTVYYEVTATGGDVRANKGVNTVAVSTTALEEAPESGNYFKVTTGENGTPVAIDYYGKIPLDGTDTTDMNIVVDAASAKDIAGVAINIGTDTTTPTAAAVAKYTVENLTKNQAVTNGSKAAAVAYEYEKSFTIADGSKVAFTLADVADWATAPVSVYYVVQIDASKDGSDTQAAKGVTEYKLTKLTATQFATWQGSATASEVEATKHYFQVTYSSQYNVSATYVNVGPNADKYDFSAVGMPRVTVDASALYPIGGDFTVDSIDLSGKATYELTHVKGGNVVTVTENGSTTLKNVVVNYDAIAVLSSGTITVDPTKDAPQYYLVTAGTAKDGVIPCTVATTATAEKDLDDTKNYFVVTKTTGGYTVSYLAAKSGDALVFSPTGDNKSTLTVDLQNVPGAKSADDEDKVTITNGANTKVAMDMTNAKGGVVIDSATNTTIAYKTKVDFATPGIYYVQVAGDDKDATIANNTEATIASGDTKKFLVITVAKDEDGLVTVSSAAKAAQTTTTGMPVNGAGTNYSGKITFDATGLTKFDAVGLTTTGTVTVTNVANSAVVVVADGDTVKTASLSAGNTFTVNGKKFTAGDTGEISVVADDGTEKAKVDSGTLLLASAEERLVSTAAATTANIVTIIENGTDGVVVTFDGAKGITGISDLEAGESVDVTENGVKYHYSSDGTYITKMKMTDFSTERAAATTGNIFEQSYYPGEGVTVGTFSWDGSGAAGPFYVAADSSSAEVTLAAGTEKAKADNGVYYIKATRDASNIWTLQPVLGNAVGFVDDTDAFTGTVVMESEALIKLAKTSDKYTIKATKVVTGSVFTGLTAGDIVEGLANAAITVNGQQYTPAADTALKFANGGLLDGSVAVGSSDAKFVLSDGSTITVTGDGVNIVVENGEIVSLKNLEANATFTITNKETVTTYKTDNSDATKVTKSVKDVATGEITETVYTLAAANGEVIGAAAGATTLSVANDWAWADKKYGYFLITKDGNGKRIATIPAASTADPVSYTKDSLGFVKAEVSVAGGVATLKVTPMAIEEDGSIVPDELNQFNGTLTVNVADGTKVAYDGTGNRYNVAFENAGDGSEFTLTKAGDTVATADFKAGTQTVKVNGTAFTPAATAAANALAIYSDGKDAEIVNGVIVAKGTVISSNNGSGKATLVYTEGTVKDGVIATYVAGAVTSVTDLETGEQVVISDMDGNVTTYKAHDTVPNLIWETKGSTTRVRTPSATTKNLLDDSDETDDQYKYTAVVDGTNDGKKSFDWAGATPAARTGYFLVSDGAAAVAAGTTLLSYQNVGKTYLVATYDDSAKTLTFKKETATKTGLLTTTSAPLVTGDKDIKLAIDAAGNKVVYSDYIEALTVTNAGAGSSFVATGSSTRIKVTTASLEAGETLTVGTHKYTSAGGALIVSGDKAVNGAFRLSENTGASEDTITATYEDADHTVTTSTATYTAGTDKVDVVLDSDGTIVSVTGLGVGETVTTTVATSMKDGTKTNVKTVYAATATTVDGTEYIKVVKTVTDMISGETTEYEHLFNNDTQDVWNETNWDVNNATTDGGFDWTGTGYFYAEKAAAGTDKGKFVIVSDGHNTGKVATVASYDITSANEGKYYIAVDSKKNLDGSYTVNSVTLMQVQPSGVLLPVTGESLGTITFTTLGSTAVPTTHDGKFVLEGAADGVYTVGSSDVVSVANMADGAAFTVGDTTYKSAAATNDVAVQGDGKIVTGTIWVKGEVSGSGTPTKVGDSALQTVKYETTSDTNKDGVIVTFAVGEIGAVKGLQDGETVTLTHVAGVMKSGKVVTEVDMTTTITAEPGSVDNKTLVTKTTENAFTKKLGEKLVMTKEYLTAAAGTTEVSSMADYTVANKFNYGAKDGKIGVFAGKYDGGHNLDSLTVTAQDEGGTFVGAIANDYFAIVGATQDTKGNSTIGFIAIEQYQADGSLLPIDTRTLPKALTIDAPTSGNLTIAADAVQLYTVYNTDGTINKLASEMERGCAIVIDKIVDGATYSGLGDVANDRVTGALKANETVSVVYGKKTYSYETAGAGTVTLTGKGAAVEGDFKLDAKHTEIALEKVNGVTDGTTVITRGSGDARVLIANQKLQSITELGKGEKVTVTETTEAGKVTTTTFEVNSAGNEVTKTVVLDGSTTKYTMALTETTDVWADSDKWEAEDGTKTTSQFNWTAKKGAGYFALDVTRNEAGKVTGIGDVTVGEQKTAVTISKPKATDPDKYYLKVTPNADGTVTSVSVVKLAADGQLVALANSDYATLATTTGTITITAPAEAVSTNPAGVKFVPPLTYDNVVGTAGLTAVKVNIVGATAGSDVTLKAGDTMTTAALAAGNVVEVNTNFFTAGASTTMKFLGTGVVSSGVIRMNSGDTFNTSGAGDDEAVGDNAVVTYTAGATPETPVVTVTNGVVTAITGLTQTDGTVTVAVGGNTFTYTVDAQGVMNVSAGAATTADITLAALTEGATISFNSGATVFTSGMDDNSVKFADDGGTLKVVDGVLKPASGVAINASGGKSVTITDVGGVDAVVTVENGEITSIKGLGANDTIVYNGQTYNVAADGTTLTTTVATKVHTAYITKDTDLLTATFVGDGADALTAENKLVGQLSWDSDIAERQTSYFKLATKKVSGVDTNVTTVAEQSAAQEVKLPTKKVGTERYIVTTFDRGTRTISLSAMEVTASVFDAKNNTVAATTKTIDVTDTTATKFFDADDVITITAPTDAGIVYDKQIGVGYAQFSLLFNKLAKDSMLLNLTKGDKVVTTTLGVGDMVTVDGNAYVAGAKNALTIYGEAKADGSGRTASLYAGTIKLTNAPGGQTTAVLSGEKDDKGDATNNLTVQVAGENKDVVVKVTNGTIASITGLQTQGATVTVKDAATKTAYVYSVTDAKGLMIKREVWSLKDDGSLNVLDPTKTLYKAMSKAGQDVNGPILSNGKVGNGYVELVDTKVTKLDITSNSPFDSYIALAADPTANKQITTNNTNTPASATKPAPSDLISTTPLNATPDQYYLHVKGKTAAAADDASTKVITITSLDLMQANGKGTLANVKAADGSYGGTLTVNGMIEGATAATVTYARVAYTLPTEAKRVGNWTLNATNVALGSTFTNLKDTDMVTTAANSQVTLSAKLKTVTAYTWNTGVENTETVTYDVVKDGVTVKYTGADTITVTGLDQKGEKVTVVTNHGDAGRVTKVFEVKDGKILLTMTDANGVKKIYTSKADAATATDVIALSSAVNLADVTKWTVGNNSIDFNFDWTLDQSATGYFEIKSGKTTVGPLKKTLTTSGNYVEVTINADGTVSNARAVKATVTKNGSTVTNTTIDPGSAFTGTITVTAPKTGTLTLNRGAFHANLANAKLDVKGANALSTFTALKADDKVATASLKVDETVTLNNHAFTAAKAGALTFEMKTIDSVLRTTLTSGTVTLTRTDGSKEGTDFVYVGSKKIEAYETAEHQDPLDPLNPAAQVKKKATIMVTASGNGKSFSIASLDEGDTFRVDGALYMKSGSNLYRVVTNSVTKAKEYAVHTAGASIASTVFTDNAWKSVTDTFAAADALGLKKSNFGAVTVDLAILDNRYKNDGKNNTVPAWGYDFVIDSKLLSTTSKTAAMKAAVINDTNLLDLQTVVGSSAKGTYVYTAAVAYAQTIKATDGWTVKGSNGADIITGASKGKDKLVGGQGNDTLTGGAAEDTFVFDLTTSNKDVVKSYVKGKDKVELGVKNFSVKLNQTAKSADVLLWNDLDGDGSYGANEHGVLLEKMGNNSPITISTDGGLTYANYYFGNGTLAKGSATFAYEDGAYYYGNKALTNTVKVATDKTKATKTSLGEMVTIDLTAKDKNGRTRYNEIKAVDASASGNSLYLKAAAGVNTTLKGGTYQTTLEGGSGNDSLFGGSGADMFWFKTGLSGQDTIKSYAAKNDAVYLGAWGAADADATTIELANGSSITVKASADNKSVVLTQGDGTKAVTLEGALGSKKAVRISKDGTQANTLSYYVGSTAKNAANTFEANIGVDTDVIPTATVTVDDIALKSYYIGSNNTLNDKLQLVGEAKTWTTGAGTELDPIVTHTATFSLQSNNLSSIDWLDASRMKAGSTLKLIGGLGDCTLQGSTSTKSVETFGIAYTTAATKGKTTTVKGFSVDDVIELGANITATMDTKKSTGSKTYFNLTIGATTTEVGTLVVEVGKSKFNTSYAGTAAGTKIKQN